MLTYVKALSFSAPTWKMVLNLLMAELKIGFPTHIMSSTNKLITPINSLCFWKRKIPRSNLECLATSLHSSSRTLRYQYRDASASPYMHLCNLHILSVCASFGGLTRTFCSNSFSCRNAVLTSIEWICHFFVCDEAELNMVCIPSLEHVGLLVRKFCSSSKPWAQNRALVPGFLVS